MYLLFYVRVHRVLEEYKSIQPDPLPPYQFPSSIIFITLSV